jgi:hypothetical protein
MPERPAVEESAKVAVRTPTVPNFITLVDGQTLPLSAFSNAALRRIGVVWAEALVRRAQEQREEGDHG